MALYRQVHCAFWSDDTDILETFSPEDKYFYLYLLTNPHTTQCGIYEISIKHMILETGYNQETIEKLIDRFETTYKKIKYNRTTKELAIKNWTKYNNIKSPKVQICVERELAEIKDKSLISFINTVSIVYEDGIAKKKKNNNRIEEEDRVKIPYSDYVTLLETEHQKLVDLIGERNTKLCITKLNDYKGAKGKKYKSDYLAIRNWVIQEITGKPTVEWDLSKTIKRKCSKCGKSLENEIRNGSHHCYGCDAIIDDRGG